MDFDITKVSIDGTVDDLTEEQLRELVTKFRDAQESNVAEFEQAAEAMDEVDESDIKDFEAARESLIEDITGAEAFDEVPITEEKLEDEDFSDLQDWKGFVSETDVSDEETDEADEDEADFDDMGKKAPVDGGDADEEFAEDVLGDMPGLSL